MLLQNIWNIEDAEALDCDHQRACHYAASKCKKKPNIAFVRKIAELQAKKNVLLKIISGSRLRKDFDMQIAFSLGDISGFLIPGNLTQCKLVLRKIQKEIRKTKKDAVNRRKQELEESIDNTLRNGDKKIAQNIK